MPELLSCEEIWAGVLPIEHVVLTLDYAMWVENEYDGLGDDAQIEILEGTNKEYSAAITDYVAKHREELVCKWLKCPRCGEIGWPPDLETCPREVYKAELQPPRHEICGRPLEVVLYNDNERYLREQAGFALARAGAFVNTKIIIAGRVVMRALQKSWLPDTEFRTRLADLRRHITDELSELNDRLTAGISLPDPVRLLRRRNLYPRGPSLADKYADYLCVRDKFINCYHWLDGQTANHPYFIERQEQSRGIRNFSQPVIPSFTDRRAADVPVWDSDRRELRFRGRVCKHYRKSPAPNQTSILDAFQTAAWKQRVDDVCDPDGEPLTHRRLLETIRALKKGLKHITFVAAGTGRSVVWEPVIKPSSKRR